MSFTIIWTVHAVKKIRDLRAEDPEGAALVAQSVTALANDQQPAGSNQLGRSNFRRLHLGPYRVLYEIDGVHSAIAIHSVGRTTMDREPTD